MPIFFPQLVIFLILECRFYIPGCFTFLVDSLCHLSSLFYGEKKNYSLDFAGFLHQILFFQSHHSCLIAAVWRKRSSLSQMLPLEQEKELISTQRASAAEEMFISRWNDTWEQVRVERGHKVSAWGRQLLRWAETVQTHQSAPIFSVLQRFHFMLLLATY